MSNYLQEKINNSFSYIPLRATSPYSLLQGAVTMDKISQNCLDYNIPAVAIVDNNNLFGALEFCEHMSHKGIQPIIGCNLNIKSEKHRGSLVLSGCHQKFILMIMVKKLLIFPEFLSLMMA